MRHVISIFLIVVLFGVASRTAESQTSGLVKLKAELSALEESGRFSGVVLAVRDRDTLLNEAYGLAVREWGVRNTSNSVFLIGSITKQFTAAAILLLQDRGALSLSDPFCTYYPRCPESWKRITIRQLLDHTSGIPDIVRLPDFETAMREKTTLDRTIGKVAGLPLMSAPGSRFQYGNSGYLIAARLIELVSGMTYDQFMQTEIYDKLRMPNSGYAFNQRVVPRLAFGYQSDSTGVRRAAFIDMSLPAGAGSQYSDARDLVRYARALFGGDLLTRSALAEITRPRGGDYSLGWHVNTRHGGRVMEHVGDINGYGAYLMVFPESKTVIAVLSNQEGAAVQDIARRIEAAITPPRSVP